MTQQNAEAMQQQQQHASTRQQSQQIAEALQHVNVLYRRLYAAAQKELEVVTYGGDGGRKVESSLSSPAMAALNANILHMLHKSGRDPRDPTGQ